MKILGDFKIILKETPGFNITASFIEKSEEVIDLIKNLIAGGFKVEIYSYESDKKSNLIKLIRDEVKKVIIKFVDEKSLSNNKGNKIDNIIGIISKKEEITSFNLKDHETVNITFTTDYVRMRKLAAHVSNLS